MSAYALQEKIEEQRLCRIDAQQQFQDRITELANEFYTELAKKDASHYFAPWNVPAKFFGWMAGDRGSELFKDFLWNVALKAAEDKADLEFDAF